MPRFWLFAVVACAAAHAGPPPPAQPTSPPDPPEVASTATAPGGSVPDDEFIEFLGADDVGDAAWWDFLTKSAPRKERTPVPPSQDAKP